MSNSVLSKRKLGADWRQLNRQVIQAKALIRSMREMIEDIEDARIIEQVKKQLGFEF